MSNVQLYLHRIVLRDPLALQRVARDRGLPDRPYDEDYILHSVLTELFGTDGLRTFTVDPRSRGEAVLAYSGLSSREIEDKARAVTPPEVFNLVDWQATQGKAMPTEWPVGRELAFRVRVSPIVRGPKGHGKHGATVKNQRPEVDAYLARCWQESAPPERESVYREWVESELARGDAAEALEIRMTGFRLKRGLRRDGSRRARTITRPDALCKGRLRIVDACAFETLLARGLGRHRSFGFGMLLLTAENG